MKYHTTSTVCLPRRPSDEGVQIPVVSFNLALIPDLSSEKRPGKREKDCRNLGTHLVPKGSQLLLPDPFPPLHLGQHPAHKDHHGRGHDHVVVNVMVVMIM